MELGLSIPATDMIRPSVNVGPREGLSPARKAKVTSHDY
jgi:hypothetical protein